jgi:hypothetical protein
MQVTNNGRPAFCMGVDITHPWSKRRFIPVTIPQLAFGLWRLQSSSVTADLSYEGSTRDKALRQSATLSSLSKLRYAT